MRADARFGVWAAAAWTEQFRDDAEVVTMALLTTIADITNRLRQGRFPNEQAISQGIVLRLLQELGWDTWDTALVWPEYQTGEGRADFALCHPPTKPATFIEVKQPGRAEDGVRQALEYAFHTGVPFIVLTDGKTWSFYLPAEQGSYEDRRVHKLDLFERDQIDVAKVMSCYLSRERVESGEALETARLEYRSRNRTAQAKAAIPEAWRELIGKGDESLVELVATAVESKAGVRPVEDDVIAFLSRLGTAGPLERFIAPVRRAPGPESLAVAPSSPVAADPAVSSRRGTLTLREKRYVYNNAVEAMIMVLRMLAEADATFLSRCAQHPDAQGRKRRYIARTTEELYPDRPDLRELHAQLPGGWLVATNLNNLLKKNIIHMAAEVAGLSYGSDIAVEF